jgi:hypothetical protein
MPLQWSDADKSDPRFPRWWAKARDEESPIGYVTQYWADSFRCAFNPTLETGHFRTLEEAKKWVEAKHAG